MEEKSAPTGKEHGGDDQSGRLVRDLVTSPPPKGLDTVTAASDAANKAGAQGAAEEREHRIRTRAYELWEQDGRASGGPDDFWRRAEAEIAGEDTRA